MLDLAGSGAACAAETTAANNAHAGRARSVFMGSGFDIMPRKTSQLAKN
jgi:hypothetical protein